MSIYVLKSIFALIILSITLLAGWYPFYKRKRTQQTYDFPIGESFATGIFLGAGLLHMLPDSNVFFGAVGYKYPVAYLLAGAAFLIFLWLEHLGREIYAHHEENHPAFAIVALFMLSIHSLLAGAALGFMKDYSIVIMLFFAIISHKWAASFAIAVHLNKTTLRTQTNLLFFSVFSVMTPLGILLGSITSSATSGAETLYEAIFAALAAGTFLYLGTLHGLERGVMVKRCCNLRDFSFVIIGFAIMAIVAIYS